MRSLICLAVAASLAAAAAPVAIAATAKPAAKAAAAPTWVVDKAASKLGFKSSFSGTEFEGSFRTWDANIAFDPKNVPASRVTVTVNTASATSGDRDRDETLPTGEWFAVSKFPTATFTSTSFKDLGGGKYQATGNLNLKGVSRPVTINFTLAFQGDVARMNGSAVIARNNFNVGQGQFAAADTVPYNVTVPISIVARRAK